MCVCVCVCVCVCRCVGMCVLSAVLNYKVKAVQFKSRWYPHALDSS